MLEFALEFAFKFVVGDSVEAKLAFWLLVIFLVQRIPVNLQAINSQKRKQS